MKVLHLEDNPLDAELISYNISGVWPHCEIVRVGGRSEFEQALNREPFDLILSDFKIPNFSGEEALIYSQKHYEDTPFIFVSGTIGEGRAVESLKRGATDYILKDAPQRLIPAIERALEDSANRRKQRKIEHALAESEAKFRILVERALVGIYLIQDGKLIYTNPAFCQMVGYSQEEIHSLPLEHFIAPEDRPLVRQNVRTRIHGEKNSIRYEVRLLHKNGSIVYTEAHGTRIEVNGEPAIIGTLVDNTLKKAMEAQVLRAQRIESIGSLASGIAHDLNNVLSPIMMAADMLQAEETKSTSKAKWLEIISTNTRRGAEMVKRILTFARGSEGPRKEIRLGDLIRDQEKFIRRTFQRSIQVQVNCPDSLWPVEGNETEIYQVLMNLCVNARDALIQGGTITICAGNRKVGEDEASKILGASAGNYVLLSVQDTGTGIPIEILDKIFDPFFSTKGQGEGTGLGLSTVIKIVKSHRGFLTVDSKMGEGTRFDIFLPAMATSH